MAEGIMNYYCGDKFEARSAGIEKTKVHPLAKDVMKEIGIDISQQYSKTIDEYKEMYFHLVVTVCDHAREACPFFPGERVMHKAFTDPSTVEGKEDEKLQAFRVVRDQIKEWITASLCSGQIS
jgi:arsenate reductase